MWDVNTGQFVQLFESDYVVYSVCATSDGKWMLSRSRDSTICKWDVATGECMNTLEGYINPVFLPGIHKSGIVCSRTYNNIGCIWNSEAKVINKTTNEPQYDVECIRSIATGTRMLSDNGFDEDYCV